MARSTRGSLGDRVAACQASRTATEPQPRAANPSLHPNSAPTSCGGRASSQRTEDWASLSSPASASVSSSARPPATTRGGDAARDGAISSGGGAPPPPAPHPQEPAGTPVAGA